MKGKSIQPSFSKEAERKIAYQKGLSHSEVRTQLKKYAAVAKDQKHQQHIKTIGANYQKQWQKQVDTRLTKEHYFKAGKEIGLHQGKSIEQYQKEVDRSEQQHRNMTIKEAKTYYHKNYSTTKTFNKDKGKINRSKYQEGLNRER